MHTSFNNKVSFTQKEEVLQLPTYLLIPLRTFCLTHCMDMIRRTLDSPDLGEHVTNLQ